MTEKPTLTETGKAVRELEGYPDIKEEKTIPVLTDTSVWKKTMNFEATEEHSGVQEYTSEYGKVRIMQEKKEKTYKYGIVYKNKKVYITVIDEGEYNVGFEAVENGETVSRQLFYSSDTSRSVGRRRFKPRIIVGVIVPRRRNNSDKGENTIKCLINFQGRSCL